MIVRMRKENAAYEKPLTPQIENLVLIDRRVDLMTPMCTQLTYEVCNHMMRFVITYYIYNKVCTWYSQ